MQAKGSYNYDAKEPKIIYVSSRNSNDWINLIENTIRGVKVQALVLIIPGPKGKNQIYNDLKKHFTCDTAIVCQCIINNTCLKGNLK